MFHCKIKEDKGEFVHVAAPGEPVKCSVGHETTLCGFHTYVTPATTENVTCQNCIDKGMEAIINGHAKIERQPVTH